MIAERRIKVPFVLAPFVSLLEIFLPNPDVSNLFRFLVVLLDPASSAMRRHDRGKSDHQG